MRRQVRYTQLGPSRQVKLVFGMDRNERDAEIIDESMSGFGLRMDNVAGLEPGQKVTVRHPKGEFAATVMRIESMREGRYLVGLQTGPHSGR